MPTEICGDGFEIHEALVPSARQRYNVRHGDTIICFCYTLKEARAEVQKIKARVAQPKG
jgi:hypothetical protein